MVIISGCYGRLMSRSKFERLVQRTAGISLVVAVVSGVLLLLVYQPSSAWETETDWPWNYGLTMSGITRVLHLVASGVFVASSLVWAIALAVAKAPRLNPGDRGVALGAAALLTLAAIVSSGTAVVGRGLLPWDMLVLNEIDPDTTYSGYLVLADDSVRGVLRRGREVLISDVFIALGYHMALAIFVVALTAGARAAVRSTIDR